MVKFVRGSGAKTVTGPKKMIVLSSMEFSELQVVQMSLLNVAGGLQAKS